MSLDPKHLGKFKCNARSEDVEFRRNDDDTVDLHVGGLVFKNVRVTSIDYAVAEDDVVTVEDILVPAGKEPK